MRTSEMTSGNVDVNGGRSGSRSSHGHEAVEPLRVAIAVKPHVTSQLPAGQFVTVQPEGGQVMLQSGPFAQST